jgi:hypothetical protein
VQPVLVEIVRERGKEIGAAKIDAEDMSMLASIFLYNKHSDRFLFTSNLSVIQLRIVEGCSLPGYGSERKKMVDQFP